MLKDKQPESEAEMLTRAGSDMTASPTQLVARTRILE